MAKIAQNTKTQITDTFLNTFFNNDQNQRPQAILMAEEYIAKFGIFLGFYNKVNNTSIGVDQGLHIPDLVKLYNDTITDVKNKIVCPAVVAASKKPKSTKLLSYQAFQNNYGTSVAHTVYKTLKTSSQALSRVEIAQQANLRLSTVCGQVSLLKQSGLVKISGTKIDPDSNREVETLEAL